MKCRKCNSTLVIRNGKFGEFYACPKSNPSDNHGTVSLLPKETGQTRYNRAYHGSVGLDKMIQAQMMYMGGGRMTDLDLFIEGGEDAANDDPDHWMNTRPY